MHRLDDFPGGDFYNVAWDVSDDGKIVVGSSTSDLGVEAFIWHESLGMRKLKDVLTIDYGLDLTGWKLNGAWGISADGITMVGDGANPDGLHEAWIATVPRPNYPCNIPGDTNGDCVVDLRDLAILCSYWLNCNLFPESACWK